jgi:hypothetical protein
MLYVYVVKVRVSVTKSYRRIHCHSVFTDHRHKTLDIFEVIPFMNVQMRLYVRAVGRYSGVTEYSVLLGCYING